LIGLHRLQRALDRSRYWRLDYTGAFMTGPLSNGANADLVAALPAALAAGTREAFTALLTEDVHWGGSAAATTGVATARRPVITMPACSPPE
jgi:hypothetical protein